MTTSPQLTETPQPAATPVDAGLPGAPPAGVVRPTPPAEQSGWGGPPAGTPKPAARRPGAQVAAAALGLLLIGGLGGFATGRLTADTPTTTDTGVVDQVPGQGGPGGMGGMPPGMGGMGPGQNGTLPDGTLPDGTLPDGTAPDGSTSGGTTGSTGT